VLMRVGGIQPQWVSRMACSSFVVRQC
jgi:hypothetical protein